MLHRVTPRVTSCIGTQEPDVQTQRTNIFVKDPPGVTHRLFPVLQELVTYVCVKSHQNIAFVYKNKYRILQAQFEESGSE